MSATSTVDLVFVSLARYVICFILLQYPGGAGALATYFTSCASVASDRELPRHALNAAALEYLYSDSADSLLHSHHNKIL